MENRPKHVSNEWKNPQNTLPLNGNVFPPYLQPVAPGSSRLKIHAVPRASKSALAGVHGDALKVKLAAPPADGAANAELLAFLAKRLGLPKSRVTLLSGHASREKTVLLDGLSPADALPFLQP